MGSPPFLVVLGIAQDAGVPQAGCLRACCRAARRDPALRRHAACLAVVDPAGRWLIDATPDFREQLARLDRIAPPRGEAALDGIFLTHGHVGHYAGLIHLGREALNAVGLPVHAMPRMSALLRRNAPWEQLVALGNIRLVPMRSRRPVAVGVSAAITPLLVPHRGEYTETVAFRVAGPSRAALWLPDIDRWEPWEVPLERALAEVDAAWLDGTFFAPGELQGRDPTKVPHPLVERTLDRLAALPLRERRKVRFVHLNHTNPALRPASPERRRVERLGMHVAREGERFSL